MPAEQQPARWHRQPAWATALRVAVFCLPVLASFAAAWGVSAALAPASGLGGRAAQLLLLAATSTVVLVLVDRGARRALPLVTLLDLSMLFPDRAPSRLRIAREAIRNRPIEEQLARVRDAGADPGAVAREILTLVAALSRHDRPTRGHAERVRMFTDLLAAQLKIPQRDRDLLRWAAILHDIGKLAVPAALLNKPGKPTDEEWALLQAHPAHGARIAGPLLPWLGEWGRVIAEHHERYDGTGYPTGLAGAQIGLGARIVSVADAYDVMTAARAYKRPVSRAAALEELVRWSGRQFDPMVVRAMVAVGAPRLRRAQGLLAWLADLPLVATGSVPTATVARVVGAGALATGAVTGGVALSDGLEPPRAHAGTTATAAADPRGDRDAGRRTSHPRATTSGSRAAADPAGAEPPARSGPAPGPAPEATAAPGAPAAPAAPAATSARGDTGSTAGAGAAGTTSDRPDERGQGGDAVPQPAPSLPSEPARPVGKVVDDTVSAVGKIVEDPVGAVGGTVGRVTDTVEDIASDPVHTVEDVVTDPVGTVGDTVGGLLGGGSAPSPSPSPSASGGLLGGLLGR